MFELKLTPMGIAMSLPASIIIKVKWYEVEANQFSITTKLVGNAIFLVADILGNGLHSSVGDRVGGNREGINKFSCSETPVAGIFPPCSLLPAPCLFWLISISFSGR